MISSLLILVVVDYSRAERWAEVPKTGGQGQVGRRWEICIVRAVGHHTAVTFVLRGRTYMGVSKQEAQDVENSSDATSLHRP